MMISNWSRLAFLTWMNNLDRCVGAVPKSRLMGIHLVKISWIKYNKYLEIKYIICDGFLLTLNAWYVHFKLSSYLK